MKPATAREPGGDKAALRINYLLYAGAATILFENFYQSLQTSSFRFAQSVGIDTGEIRVARAGVRNDNDLIWVGGAPNVAAKLSSIREQGYSTYITEKVFKKLHDTVKFFNGQSMWECLTWQKGEPYGAGIVYRSSWWFKPSYFRVVL